MDQNGKTGHNKNEAHKFLGITYSEEFLENKYNHLLSIFVVLFLIAPFIDRHFDEIPFTGMVFFASIVFTLRAVIDRKDQFRAITFVISTGFCLYLLIRYKVVSEAYHYHITFMSVLAFTIALFIAIHALSKKITAEEEVSTDTIKGGICMYILIGLAFAQLYFLIYLFDNNAFSVKSIHLGDLLYFQYYSFTVITTLGFGDITPVNKIAMNMSYLEALTGQMVIAIFIARLIALNMAHDQKKMLDRIISRWTDESE